ncbi:hypothetical protein [Duganella radicis]|uniref:Uncharacterized protein n=1 Tax=Duganella radicis TaxID=551988 RepID=A0A6L6PS78_9BURK|nr:hypothetical protein [Duganella radicis]MTV41501.1 hypothetical protein [Duganella radicis]
MAILEFFVPLLFDVVFYGVGQVVIPIVSLGRARAETPKEAIYSSTVIYTRADGKLIVSGAFTMVVGIACLVLLCILAYQFQK